MSKFIIIATLFLAMLAVCLTYAHAAAPNGNPQQNANGIIHKIIGQYEARYQGPSIVHPEEPAKIVDPQNLSFI